MHTDRGRQPGKCSWKGSKVRKTSQSGMLQPQSIVPRMIWVEWETVRNHRGVPIENGHRECAQINHNCCNTSILNFWPTNWIIVRIKWPNNFQAWTPIKAKFPANLIVIWWQNSITQQMKYINLDLGIQSLHC